jgi:hypothetical protein
LRRTSTFLAAVALLTLIAAVRVASTHRVFSEVLDEPAHLAAGYQWFDGNYTLDASHPPLARVLGALPLRWAGFPKSDGRNAIVEGNNLYYHGNRYEKTLARTRIGNVLLLVVACVATAAWARRLVSAGTAIVALAFLTAIPAVLGHAGVLTTDLGVLTSIVLALLALDLFLVRPTIPRGAFLGAAIGIGLLAKFSFLVLFPPCALVAIWMRTPRHFAWRAALVAIAVAFFVTWSGYRFDFRTAQAYAGDHAIAVVEQSAPTPLRPFAGWIARNVPLPAPAFLVGIGMVRLHDAEGHDAYLWGEVSREGWWYYFPVVLFYKTPLPFLLLVLWGAAMSIRRRDRMTIGCLLMALAILGIAMTSSINIGIRHILAVYAPLSIVAAYGAADVWLRRDTFARTTLVALGSWLFIGVAVDHPDYLAWFNELAQPNPAQIAVDSNLDWGQDTLRLARVVREMQIEKLHIDITSNVWIEPHGLHALEFDAAHKTSGWLAVSETQLALKRRFHLYEWLSTYRPVRQIGKSIRLYAIP